MLKLPGSKEGEVLRVSAADGLAWSCFLLFPRSVRQLAARLQQGETQGQEVKVQGAVVAT